MGPSNFAVHHVHHPFKTSSKVSCIGGNPGDVYVIQPPIGLFLLRRTCDYCSRFSTFSRPRLNRRSLGLMSKTLFAVIRGTREKRGQINY